MPGINSIAKLQAANRMVASGTLSPEEEAALRDELNASANAVSMGLDINNFHYRRASQEGKNLSPEHLELANQINAEKWERDNRLGQAKNGAILAGAEEAVTEIAQAVTDVVGVEDWSEAIERRQEKQEVMAQNWSREVKEEVFGRELTEEELVANKEEVGKVIENAKLGTSMLATAPAGLITAGTRGLIGGIVWGAAEGAVIAGATTDTKGKTREDRNAERLGNLTLGAMLGGGVGLVTGAGASVRNLIAGQMRKYREGADSALALEKEFDTILTLGQITGNPTIQAAERATASKRAQEFLAAQSDTLPKKIANKIRVLVRPFEKVGDTPSAGREVFSVLDSTVKDLKQAGQAAWKQGVARAKQAGGDSLILPAKELNELKFQIDDISMQMFQKFDDSIIPGNNLRALQADIDSAIRKGGVTIDQLDTWWLKVNAMKAKPTGTGFARAGEEGADISSAEAMLETLSARLALGMKRTLDATPSTPQTVEALNLLKAGRDKWSKNHETVRFLNDEVLRPLGLQGDATSAQILNSLSENVDVSSMRAAMDYIRKSPGGALKTRQIRETLFEAAVNAGLKSGKPGMAGKFGVTEFVDAFKANNARSKLAGVITPEEEKIAARSIDLARKIMNEGAVDGAVKRTINEGAAEVAINLVSMNPAFMARLVAGAASRGKGAEWLFYSKEGLEILKSMTPEAIKFGKTSAVRNAGIAYLAGTLGDGAKEKVYDENVGE